MVVKVARRRRPFKVRRRTTVRKTRVSRPLKVTKILNASRYADMTVAGGFSRAGSITVGNGYMVMTSSATLGAITYGSVGVSFKVDDMPNIAEYGALYEQYRINKVVMKIIPMATSVAAGAALTGSTTQTGIIFHYCLDHDDATVPPATEAGVNALRQRTGYRTRNIYQGNGKPLTFSFKPYVMHDNEPRKAGWINEGDLTIPHYGVKFIAETVSAGTQMDHFFKVETKFYVSLKGMQ